MSYCPTNEDLEFSSLRCSLCLQLCHATPNFKPPDEQASEWLVSRYGRDVNPYDELASNAPCGLCALYARAWTRLELAICDQEVDDSRAVPYCLADAAGFGACLPRMSDIARDEAATNALCSVWMYYRLAPICCPQLLWHQRHEEAGLRRRLLRPPCDTGAERARNHPPSEPSESLEKGAGQTICLFRSNGLSCSQAGPACCSGSPRLCQRSDCTGHKRQSTIPVRGGPPTAQRQPTCSRPGR